MFDELRAQFFPYELKPGITAYCLTNTAAFWNEAGSLMNAIFPPYATLGAFRQPEERAAKSELLARLFAQAHHEYFVFRSAGGEPVGYSYGDMRDRATFFMTSSGVLPQYQQQGLYSGFLKRFLSYLYALGYERVVSNHQTNNRAVIIAKLKAGFNVTAVNLDERWGAQVELTYLFHEDRRQGYASAFSLEAQHTPVSHA